MPSSDVMRLDEAEYESDTHACQGERAVDAVCTHHLRIVIVDPKERIEEQIFGRGGVLRDAVAEAVRDCSRFICSFTRSRLAPLAIMRLPSRVQKSSMSSTGRCWYLWGVLVWLIVKNVTSLTILKHYDFI